MVVHCRGRLCYRVEQQQQQPWRRSVRKGSQVTLFIDAGNLGHCLEACRVPSSNYSKSNYFPVVGVNGADLYGAFLL